MESVDNNALLGNLFSGTEEEILKADQGGGSEFKKIEQSCMVLCRITMAKQHDSASSASKDFVLDLETEDGVRLTWKAGWYIGKDGTIKDSKGNIKFQAINLAKIHWMLTGRESLPAVSPATIKENVWDKDLKKFNEITATRNICPEMIGKLVYAQIVRVRSNKQVDSGGKTPEGYAIYVDSPDERFENQVRKLYDSASKQTPGEKKLGKAADIFNADEAYVLKTPILDKYKPVAGGAPAAQPAVGGFGGQSAANPAQASGFGAAPVAGGFGAQ